MGHLGYDLDSTDVNGPVRIQLRGRDVLAQPLVNRGTAFTHDERTRLGLHGLLPTGTTTMDNQLRRTYAQFQAAPTPLAKHMYLASLRDRNEVLFYRLFADHIEEMMPIVYTPTIGQAIERYSNEFNRSRGVFLSIDRPDQMRDALTNYGLSADEVDLIVVTDSEGILGIGDQGVGGILIAIGKVAVYTAAAGIHPRRVLPVVLDVGTDNLGLLNAPMYLGERHGRIRGQRYDDFIDQFVSTATELFPSAMVHWEDFGAATAHPILNRYRDQICTFNDDIQGTAAVAVAAMLAAVDASHVPLVNHRIVTFGAGTAGIGIANLLRDTLISEGLTEQEAQSRFYAVDRDGLLIEGQRMMDFQQPYARTAAEVASWQLDRPGGLPQLADVVRNAQPTILLGTSTAAGAFTESVVKQMATNAERPIIFPMSNPTARAEATPANVLAWTDGKALVATGSPFEPVLHDGVTYTIAQANNALIFPGLGLGVRACRAERITDGMIIDAARALASLSRANRQGASLLPSVTDLRLVSATVAIAVAKAADRDGVAREPLQDPVGQIYGQMWQPNYPDLVAD